MKINNLILALTASLLLVGCNNSKDSISNNSNSNNSSSSNSNEKNSTVSNEDDSFILINNEDDLFNIKNDLSASYKLNSDIVLTKDWSTLGDAKLPFSGIFDGNNHSISSMNVVSNIIYSEETNINYLLGMFGVSTGTIKDLSVSNFKVNVIKDNIDNTNYSTLVEELGATYSNLDVHIGLVAYNYGRIDNVNANVDIKANADTSTARLRVGGIAGKSNNDISNCIVSGSLDLINKDGYIRAGGLVGYASNNSTYFKNQANVSVTASITDNAKVNVGGLIGNIETCNIDSCLSIGNISASNAGKKQVLAGGLIGLIDNTSDKYEDMSINVKNSYSTGKVAANGKDSISSGFIGRIDSIISEKTKIIINDNYSLCDLSEATSPKSFLGLYSIKNIEDGSSISLENKIYESYYDFSKNYSVNDSDEISDKKEDIEIPNIFTII